MQVIHNCIKKLFIFL